METDKIELAEKLLKDNKTKLRNYIDILIKANELARLTGPSDEETLWNEHITDCAYSLPLLPKRGSAIDVGTGGGLPGIVWAICRPDLKITLLDSISRKCVQVEKMTQLLGLNNVTVVCERSEEYAKKNIAKFDFACARAVCSVGILAEYLVPFVKINGRIASFKGPKVHEEITAVGTKWKNIGLSSPKILQYKLGEIQRYFVLWTKITPAPKGIPRRAGMAEKFPWYLRK
ncbi:MAG: 16S rRNA (guanine(527)-N(7))-methyltransferase RsmG [Synergistes sp.]|nr:16S rRNA (guanine(527)-N(7))-methyltransferase RsmG [Synergistes sp.]